MKKYFMLTATIIMILISFGAYRYEGSFKVPQFKQPSISIASNRFGNIKKILWTNKYMNDDKALIVLSSRSTSQGEICSLYRVNVDSGKYNMLAEFPSHKNLSSEILFNSHMGQNKVIAAYDKGIIKIKYNKEDPGSAMQEKIEIEGFDTAVSMDCKGSLIYTRENDNLLYCKKIENAAFTMFSDNDKKDENSYYVKPQYVVNFNSLNNIISYLSLNGSGEDLYALQNGAPISTMNLPIIRNVVNARGIEDSYGFAGMNIINDSQGARKLNLFMLRGTIDKYNNDDYYRLDTIPYNTDLSGAVPAFDSVTLNQDYSLVYTSYDDNHKGTLKICGLIRKPKVIVANENILGPVSITQVYNQPGYSTYILFFTLENNSTRVKICDDNGENIKDITDILN